MRLINIPKKHQLQQKCYALIGIQIKCECMGSILHLNHCVFLGLRKVIPINKILPFCCLMHQTYLSIILIFQLHSLCIFVIRIIDYKLKGLSNFVRTTELKTNHLSLAELSMNNLFITYVFLDDTLDESMFVHFFVLLYII